MTGHGLKPIWLRCQTPIA